jgi:ABC-type uncharacterized transport system substrate-binding protein
MRKRNFGWSGWPATCVLYTACIGITGQAHAHPHGSIECKGYVQVEAGRVQVLRGELLLDAWHSQQAIALLRETSGHVDAQRLQRFAFALKMQLGRLNWLFDLQGDGQNVDIKPKADPLVDIVNERIRIAIEYTPDVNAAAARRFSLHCTDPTYYYVTAFGNTIAIAPPEGIIRSDIDPAQLASKLAQIGAVDANPAAVTVHGCAQLRMGVLDEKLGAPRAGMARMDWTCQP